MLLLTATGGLAVGCSSSNSASAIGVAASARGPITETRALAYAHAVNLRTVDVPEMSVGSPEGKAPAPRRHAFEETIYGLEGACTWTIDGQPQAIGRGESVCIRRGQVHGFENHGSVDAKFLAIATPGVFGPSYFQDLAELLAPGGPPDPAAIGAVMHRARLTPARPVAPAT
jgi:quercetin dioxygenase-like cupin family protein